jgi:hypothetical protein
MPPKQTEIGSRLAELGALLAAGTITQQEHDESRAAALGIVPKAAGGSAAVSVENSESKSRRELLALIQKWIGTKEAPCLAGDLHDVLLGTTADDGLRQQLAGLMTASRLAMELVAVFKGAPKGSVPEPFAPPAGGAAVPGSLRFARLAAREFLLGLAAALAVSQANKLEKLEEDERKTLWKETLAIIDDDDSAVNTSTVLANLKVARAAKATAKRLRSDEDEKGEKPSRAPLSDKKKADMMKQGLCFKCGKKGHISTKCPN